MAGKQNGGIKRYIFFGDSIKQDLYFTGNKTEQLRKTRNINKNAFV